MQICFQLIILLVLVQNGLNIENYSSSEEFYREYQRELYSKTVMGLVKLYQLEQQFMDTLKKTTMELQKQIDMMQIYLKYLKRPKCADRHKCEKYIANPLNGFGLMRRLHQDWPQWLKLIKVGRLANYIKKLENQILPRLPESDDMFEMQKNLQRIETTYALRAQDLAQGKFPKTQLNWNLTLRDCVTLGNFKYNIGDYQRALTWYHYALNHRPEANGESYRKMLGDPLNGVGLKYAQILLILEVHKNEPLLSIKEIRDEVEHVLREVDANSIDNLVNDHRFHQTELESSQNESITTKHDSHDLAHVSGCRGLFPQRTNLVCRFNFTTSPFLRLAPLKLEEISLDPYIVQYHDVMSDIEIEEFKKQARQAEMLNGWTSLRSKNETENENREIVARVAWLDSTTEFIERINRRITDMTGFNLKEMNSLQVAAYSVGGFFRPHYDYLSDRPLDTDVIQQLGDRVASVIFYIGDVSEGGGTNFPLEKVLVAPKKGSSLFWYNKFDDGSPDPRSLHSICPVIVGDRWTITKWIHHDSQMFLKPCSMQPSS